MLDDNQFFQALKARLKVTAAVRFTLIILTSAILPIAEGVLINLWTDAEAAQRAIPGTTLAVVGGLHVLFLIALLVAEFPTAEIALAKASEIQANADRDAKEMKRRAETYKMVRQCLSLLTKRTCDLPRRQEVDVVAPGGQGATDWCQAGFEAGLRPIIKVVLDNITTTLGVISTQYTIEVHIKPGYIIAEGDLTRDFILRFFYGLNVRKDAPTRLENDSPARIGSVWDVPNQCHISENPAVFFENGSPKQRLYFRRFATSPITEPCSDIRMGVLVLTSMQDEPFAADVCDTLQFIASIVSNYVSAYCDCRAEYEQYMAVRELLPDLLPDQQERLMGAMGIYQLHFEGAVEEPDASTPDEEPE